MIVSKSCIDLKNIQIKPNSLPTFFLMNESSLRFTLERKRKSKSLRNCHKSQSMIQITMTYTNWQLIDS